MISLDLWKNYIHGLSQIEFHHGSGRDLPAWSHATQSDREHVASLDGLALLLVFSPNGDVAAISSWRSAHEFKLLWAKNQLVDDSNQLRYIEELLENIKKGTSADTLLKIVIPMCREKIFHRVRKLANSFGVSQTDQRRDESNLWRFDETEEPCQTLEATLKKANRLKGNESTAHLLVKQVRPPAAELVEVLSGSLEVLNLRCNEIVSTEIEDWDLVTDAYDKAQPGQPAVGKKTVTFTQHCEITLALDMLKRTRPKLTKTKIEIGVSKACCEWCCEYLNLLASAYPEHSILVRASHGKQPDGWMMPPNSPTSIAQQMTRVIEERIDHVIWKINNRRRSDSNELPSFTTEVDM